MKKKDSDLILNKEYIFKNLKNILEENYINLSNKIAEELLVIEILISNLYNMTNLRTISNIGRSTADSMDLLAEEIDRIFFIYKNKVMQEIEDSVKRFAHLE